MTTPLVQKQNKIRTHLLNAGVSNLRNYGYPACTTENILTDRIYSAFFKSMLEENKGHGADADAAIEGLLAELPGEH